MSSIYIQEPPTSGKVLLKTSVGDIDIELWCREAPKACRNFIQLCMEGYYNGTIFHRVVKGFIAQGGDPNGDGTGGESIYGAPFKDEFHSRLRFVRRGLVAMANSGPNDNSSQFFFTLGEALELQNKHTVFGKVTGDTLFNMLKLEDGMIDHNERPMYPHKIVRSEILLSPFEDIVPRSVPKSEKKDRKKSKKEKGVKNFGLLSFGLEAEEDEEETNTFVQKNAGKAKSTHDALDDPKLSKETKSFIKIEKEDSDIEEYEKHEEDSDLKEKVRDKLKKSSSSKKTHKNEEIIAKPLVVNVSDSDSDEFQNELERERNLKRKRKAEEIREEINSLKKEYQKDRKIKNDLSDAKQAVEEQKESANELMQAYVKEQQKYSHLKKDLPKKGAQREQHTLALLSKFKNKLESVKEKQRDDDDDDDSSLQHTSGGNFNDAEIDEDIQTDNWLSHTLCFSEQENILARDASTKQDDWYDVYDPRNPLNKRKRGDVNAVKKINTSNKTT